MMAERIAQRVKRLTMRYACVYLLSAPCAYSIMTQLRDNQRCYVCGKENPVGLGVDFEINREQRSISAKFTPSDNHQGYEGIVHGGILSTLLDEAMAKLTVSLGIPAVTAEMTVTFKAPAAPGDELLVSGRITRKRRN